MHPSLDPTRPRPYLSAAAGLGDAAAALRRDFEYQMAAASSRAATIPMAAREPIPPPTEYFTTSGTISRATRFITLISGFSAGPAVSLNGSPTVSPMTVALWFSDPLPP